MKKGLKFLVMALVVAAFAVTAFGCATTQYVEGTYNYASQYGGADYGCRVRVSVVGNRINEVLLLESHGWTQATNMTGWGREAYLENEEEILKAYKGLTVAQLSRCEVIKNDKGEPTKLMGYPANKSGVLYTGATQSCGRIMLAVKDAISKLNAEA